MTTLVHPRIGRGELLTVLGATLSFGLLLVTWALVTPPLHGPDELANIDAAMHLALGQAWPAAGSMHYLQGLLAQNVPALPQIAPDRAAFGAMIGDHAQTADVNPMSQHPPTYFLVQSLVARALHFTTRRWDIVVLAMRLLDVVCTTALVPLVWAAVRRLTRSPRAAVVAAFALFLVPQLAQLGSSVSVWVPLVTAGAFVTWLGARVLTGDRSWWTVLALGGSLAVGTALTSAGAVAIPFAVVAVLAAPGLRWTGRLLRAVVVLAVPAVATGWWWLARLASTGSLQPDAMPATTKPWPPLEGPAPTQFAGAFWDGLSESFWGRVGRYEWPLSPILVDTLTVVVLAALVWAIARRVQGRRTLALVGVFPATALVVVIVRDWSTYVDQTGVTVNQGRFLFPAIAALIAVQAVAWLGLLTREQTRRRLGRAVVVVAPLVGLAGLGLLYSGAYQGLQFQVTADGVGTLSRTTPYGLRWIALTLAGALVLGGAALVVAWLGLGRAGFVGGRPSRTDRPAAPAGTAAADASAGTAAPGTSAQETAAPRIDEPATPTGRPDGSGTDHPLNSPPTATTTQRNNP